MRVAVIGGGVAGLAAAWRLSTVHEVVLYEASDTLGGHAKTIDVPGNNGMQPVDFGFLLCNPWTYPNLFAMFDALGVQARPIVPGVTMSASFPDGYWTTGGQTPLMQRLRPEITRFERTMQQVMAQPGDSIELTLEMLLNEEGFSSEFQQKFVVPMLSQLFITQHAALDISCLGAAFCFGPTPMLAINHPVPFSTMEQGSRQYVERLAASIDGETRTGTRIKSITRGADSVTVVDECDRSDTFDQIVLATDATTALELFSDANAEERLLLGDVQYVPCTIVIHSDPAVLPSEPEEPAAYVFIAEGATPKATSMYSTYNLRRIQSWLDSDVFATLNPPEGLIDPDKIYHTQTGWKHLVGDALQALRAGEMHRIQGKRRTWFCGTHIADAAWHEGALCTGLAVAAALGGSYPFPGNHIARISFNELAIQHMRVLSPSIDSNRNSALWPAPAMSISRHLTDELVRSEVAKKLSFGLPQAAFSRLSPLGWARAAAVRVIAPQVSPYEETMKTIESEGIN